MGCMSVKRTGQPSFIEALLPKGLGGTGQLDKLSGLVKWCRFKKLLLPICAMRMAPAGPAIRFWYCSGPFCCSRSIVCRTGNWRTR
jgi:hypothetical protein